MTPVLRTWFNTTPSAALVPLLGGTADWSYTKLLPSCQGGVPEGRGGCIKTPPATDHSRLLPNRSPFRIPTFQTKISELTLWPENRKRDDCPSPGGNKFLRVNSIALSQGRGKISSDLTQRVIGVRVSGRNIT